MLTAMGEVDCSGFGRVIEKNLDFQPESPGHQAPPASLVLLNHCGVKGGHETRPLAPRSAFDLVAGWPYKQLSESEPRLEFARAYRNNGIRSE
jgi:hypothetical protein